MAAGDKIGVCPICGSDVVENSKAYGCSHWRESDGACKFTVWKTIAKREMKPEEVKALIENKETDYLDGFVSKKGNNFSAKLCLRDGKIEMEFKPR